MIFIYKPPDFRLLFSVYHQVLFSLRCSNSKQIGLPDSSSPTTGLTTAGNAGAITLPPRSQATHHVTHQRGNNWVRGKETCLHLCYVYRDPHSSDVGFSGEFWRDRWGGSQQHLLVVFWFLIYLTEKENIIFFIIFSVQSRDETCHHILSSLAV